MATAAPACRPICCKPSGTTSAPTPTSAWTGRAASSSTPTGPAAAAPRLRQRTTCEPGSWSRRRLFPLLAVQAVDDLEDSIHERRRHHALVLDDLFVGDCPCPRTLG